jgi:hypothetical protein
VVVIAWVFFRAADFTTAGRMLTAMSGWNGLEWTASFRLDSALVLVGILWAAVWLLPNTQQILARFQPALSATPETETGAGLPEASGVPRWLQWQPTLLWAIVGALVAVFTITQMSRISEFIYWQF